MVSIVFISLFWINLGLLTLNEKDQLNTLKKVAESPSPLKMKAFNAILQKMPSYDSTFEGNPKGQFSVWFEAKEQTLIKVSSFF